MIQCSNCGYKNSDGSKICINCRHELAPSTAVSAESRYIITDNETKAEQQTEAKKGDNRALLIMLFVLFIPVILYIFGIPENNKPSAPANSVDKALVGTWSTADVTGVVGGPMTITWRFDSNGNFGDNGTKYSAKGGKLIIGTNLPSEARRQYSYVFGYAGEKYCMMINDYQTNKLIYLFYRVD